MKHEQDVPVASGAILDRIKLEYADLLKFAAFSIEKLIAPEHIRFAEFCKEFSPHPQSDELRKMAQSFGEKYGIWLASAKHYITCTLFLYPDAGFDRMAAIVKNNAVDYYLNDTMGRDVFGFLPVERQEAASQIIHRMAAIGVDLKLDLNADPLEIANAEVLTYIRDTSPAEWFSEFLEFYAHHIMVTHKDLNASAMNRICTVQEYITQRNHTAGMHHIVLLIEYNTGRFLNWTWLREWKLAEPLKRLHWCVATFGALSNDLFSFEKEVIDNDSDSNLVMMMLLNHPELTLNEAIPRACEIVQNLVIDLFNLIDSIQKRVYYLPGPVSDQLAAHLRGIERCVQASWIWQVSTKRYKRPASIWEETTLIGEPVTNGI